jgi:metal-dependent hydrolase (beta-lactamase superfamily II)
MKTMKCIIFNVEHGFCCFVKSPNGYGLLIDCGSRESFSPIKWLRRYYTVGTLGFSFFDGRRFAKCIITHLHADHFGDVASFYKDEKDKPKILLRDEKIINFLDDKIKECEAKGKTKNAEVLKTFKKFEKEYNQPVEKEPDWGFDLFKVKQLSLSNVKSVDADREKIINNRSFLIGIKYAGKKILIPGDIEVDAWKKAFGFQEFKEIVRDTNFFVASHHGHKSGFTTEILDYSGKPDIYIVSAKSGDDSIDTAYSKAENSNGYRISGRAYNSHMVSTREEQKSIEVTIDENGESSITLIDAADNLSDSQAGYRAKKAERLVRSWY